MKRLLVVVAFTGLIGCHQPAEEPVGDTGIRMLPLPEAPPPSRSAGIDFASWPAATEQPIQIDPGMFADCRAWTYSDARAESAAKRHGPHHKPAIVVRTNPEAIAAFKAGTSPMPGGTTIIKEKHFDVMAKSPCHEYGAMIKREPGYDPAHGDWEYVFVTREPEKTMTRGRLESCINCHEHAKDKDYLFRTYLPGKAGAATGW